MVGLLEQSVPLTNQTQTFQSSHKGFEVKDTSIVSIELNEARIHKCTCNFQGPLMFHLKHCMCVSIKVVSTVKTKRQKKIQVP